MNKYELLLVRARADIFMKERFEFPESKRFYDCNGKRRRITIPVFNLKPIKGYVKCDP